MVGASLGTLISSRRLNYSITVCTGTSSFYLIKWVHMFQRPLGRRTARLSYLKLSQGKPWTLPRTWPYIVPVLAIRLNSQSVSSPTVCTVFLKPLCFAKKRHRIREDSTKGAIPIVWLETNFKLMASPIPRKPIRQTTEVLPTLSRQGNKA